MSGLKIRAVRLLCPDPEATAAFYEAAFGCSRDPAADHVGLRLGDQRIELIRTPAARHAPRPSHATSFQHFAIVVTDMDAACAQLGAVPGWSPISRDGPVQLPPSSGSVRAFKFRDPDGHPLEFLSFPAGAVPDTWRREGLMLGIDHTAITVAETARSVAFYGTLGFTVASRGLNRGDTQARLDGVDDPVVEVTGLAPPGGAPPHLELLCYLSPATVPEALPADDVLATRIVLAGGDAGLREIVDPDGHRLTFEGG